MVQRGARQSATLHTKSSPKQQSRWARRGKNTWVRLERLQGMRSAAREAKASRDRGVVHTPASVAAMMAQKLLNGVRRGTRLRVLDPGCGTAQLLTAVAREAVRRDVRVVCEGVEVDTTAARWARDLGVEVAALAGCNLESWCVHRRDYLMLAARGAEFDAVIANPPWVPLRDVPEPYRLSLRAQGVFPARTDLSVLFVESMLRDLAANGRLCVIVPNKLLAADYAYALRRRLLCELHVSEVWDLSAAAPFRGRATYPVVLVARRRRPAAGATTSVRDADGRLRAVWPQETIARLPRSIFPLRLPAEAAPLLTHVFSGTCFGDHVQVACGIAASGFARAIGQGSERIVCSGDVRAFRVPSSRPFDPRAAGLDPTRLDRMRVEKIVVPGMFRRLHAGYDARGRLLGRVYYVSMDGTGHSGGRRHRTLLLALLNSRLYSVLYRGLFDAVAQSGGWLRLNGPYLNCMPWPRREPPAALATLVRQLEREDSAAARDRLDVLVESLFGLSNADRALLRRLDTAVAAHSRVDGGRA